MAESVVGDPLEAMKLLKAEAAKRGKTLKEFLDTDVRRLLEKAYEIQQRIGKPVLLDDLLAEMNKSD